MQKITFALLVAGLFSGGEYVVGDDTTPDSATPNTPLNVNPSPEVLSTTALRFRKVASTGGYAPAEETQVSVVRNGKTVKRPAIGQGGTAQIGEIAAGTYSIFANGTDGWAAFGAYLGDGNHIVTNIGLIPTSDMNVVRTLFRQHREAAQTGAAESGIDLPVAKEHLVQDALLEIQSDGSVQGVLATATPVGQMQKSLPGMSVYLIKDSQVVAQDVTTENGSFHFSGLAQGIYSMVFAGPQGFGGMSVQVALLEESTPKSAKREVPRYTFVAAAALSSPTATFTPCQWSDCSNNEPIQSSTDRGSTATNLGGQGTPGGTAGGGSGAAGGGGLLGILGAAGAGLAAAAIFDDNSPATPAAP